MPQSENSMKYNRKELLDVEVITELAEDLYIVVGMPSSIVAKDGEFFAGSGWQATCTDFHRTHPPIYFYRNCFIGNPGSNICFLNQKKQGMETCNEHIQEVWIGKAYLAVSIRGNGVDVDCKPQQYMGFYFASC